MKKIFLIQTFFIFSFHFLSGQSSPNDSVSINQNNRWHVGAYYMQTKSYNIGKKVYPQQPIIDYGIYSTFQNLKERDGLGYNVGLEIESKKILKKLSIVFGLNLESFWYTGTAEETTHDTYWYPPHVNGPFPITYFYRDNFINLPILCQYLIFTNKTNKLNVVLGSSAGHLGREINSGDSGNEYTVWGVKKNQFTSSGIVGIDYYFVTNILLNIGLRASSQISTTPNGRRLASIGIKVGLFY